MRIFITNDPYRKVNFVDDNNVFVGFDFYSNCCEEFDYQVTKTAPSSMEDAQTMTEEVGEDFPGYNFIPQIYEEFDEEEDCGGCVVFQLIHASNPPIYLTLINSHNGYYYHGFEVSDNGLIIKKGRI